MRKFTAVLLTLCLLLSSVVPSFAAVSVDSFEDVSSSDWFYTYVKWGVDNDYFAGTSATTFSPNDPATREQVVKVFANYAGEKKLDNNVSPFDDVEAGRWSAGAIKWAVDKDIAAGVGGGKFNPTGDMIRQDIAVYITNFAKWYCEKTGKVLKETASPATFSDEADISAYAKDAVDYCIIHGLLAGYPDGTFKPKKVVTRAEFVTILHAMEFILEVHTGGGNTPQPDDLIYKAMKASTETINGAVGGDHDFVNQVADQVDGYGVTGALDSIKFDDNGLRITNKNAKDNDAIDSNWDDIAHREVIVSASGEMDEDFFMRIVETAVEAAVDFQLFDAETFTKDDVKAVVKGVAGVFGIESSDAVNTMVNKIYATVKSDLIAELKPLWQNFKDDYGYYMTSVDVCAPDGTVVFTMDTNGGAGPTTITGCSSRREACKILAVAMAKEMIESAQQYTEPVSEMDLVSFFTIKFNGVDWSADRNEENDLTQFPVVYDIVAEVNLNSNGAVYYQYANGHNLYFIAETPTDNRTFSNFIEGYVVERVTQADIIKAVQDASGDQEIDTMAEVNTWMNDPYMIIENAATTKPIIVNIDTAAMKDIIYQAGEQLAADKIDQTDLPTAIKDDLKSDAAKDYRMYLVGCAFSAQGFEEFDDYENKWNDNCDSTASTLKGDIKDMDLIELAQRACDSEKAQKLAAPYLKYLKKACKMIPAKATVTIGGQSFSKADLAPIANVKTVQEAAQATKMLLAGIGSYTLQDLIDNGIVISGDYNGMGGSVTCYLAF